MKRGFFTQEQMNQMDQATAKSMKLLNAMIEGSSSSNADILEGMGSLDFSFLIQKLASYYSHLVREKLDMNPETASPQEVTTRLPKDAFDQKVLESFDVYILLSTLADHSQRVTFLLENADEYTDMEQRALEFFRLNTVHIEITFKEKLLKVYFPIYPACRQLSKNTRSEFLQEVNRESPNEKIMGLLQAAPVLFDEMEHLAYLGSKPFKFTMKRYNALRDLSNIISLVINIIIVSTEYLTIRHDQSVPEINDIGKLSSQTVINILGWIQICTSALMIIFWLRVNSPMIFREKWREEVKWKSLTPEQELKLAYMLEDRDLSELPPSVGLEILWKKGPYNPYFFLTGKRDFGHLLVHASYYYKNVIFICRNGKFLFMMFYLVVSILGTALSEITYSLHLLDVINRFKTLRNVVRSVTGNIKQLVLTALLGLILIYIYAIIGYNFFDSQYYSPDIGDAGERFCNTMLQCYLSTLNLGLRSGGGIGDMLMLPSFQPDVRMNYYFRVVFDLTFFLLINIIFLNIIFGIIVDTFAEMRDQKKAMDEDVQNKCYICNLDRNIFDKSGPGFEKHIKNDHFLWNYLFFIYSIKAKDPTEFTGIESYVQQKLKEEDISWFPMFKALEINGGATQDVE